MIHSTIKPPSDLALSQKASQVTFQADIDNDGKPTPASGLIENTATVSSNELDAQTADEDVDIVYRPEFNKVFTLVSPYLDPGQAWLPLGTRIEWNVIHTVPNYTGGVMNDAALSDRFGAELELAGTQYTVKVNGSCRAVTSVQ